MTPAPKKDLVFDPRFLEWLGAFFGAWATLELITSYGIGKFLRVSDEEAHVLAAGMEFGPKARLLRNLVYRSDDPNKGRIINLLWKIQNESKRNVFAHSFIISDTSGVSFIELSRGGDYKATEHEFTLTSFVDHVVTFTKDMAELEAAIGADAQSLARFAKAALSANTKSTKSPVPPMERA
jgi:hypothetical protein